MLQTSDDISSRGGRRARMVAAPAALLAALAVLAAAGPARADGPIEAGALDAYIARVARAWEPLVTPEGRVLDPLDAADSGDNYGVIMLADVMLKAGARDRDPGLTEAGERIVRKAATLPIANDPFNLLAIASLLSDGANGRFAPGVWAALAPAVGPLAARIGPPVPPSCLTIPGCFTNWRLVRAAGLGELFASGRMTGSEAARTTAAIQSELALAIKHASPPASPSPIHGARELSDPGPEPPSYHVFSSALLGMLADADPAALSAAIRRLRTQVTHYALELMAPDGQLSFAGRSLDQSWVQAAGAALGAREAGNDPARAAAWTSFAERSLTYLLGAYPPRADGLVPIVPGLLVEWSPAIVDTYAAFDQYEGLTLWFLSDALERWPAPSAPRGPLPVDARHMLVGDVASSGMAWGRSGPVWWALSTRTTAADRRSEQGLLAIKVYDRGVWRDLLALRPLRSELSTAFAVQLPHRRRRTWTISLVRGNGHRAIFRATYLAPQRHSVARVTLTTTHRGVVLKIAIPHRGRASTTVWPTTAAVLSASGRASGADGCTVTAAAPSCPARFSWSRRAAGAITIELQ
jgi:hypothetical protein